MELTNRKSGERVVGNASILIATQVITKPFGIILTIACARILGVEDFGLFVFANTLGGILALLAAFGLPKLVTRRVAREIDKTGEILGSILILEIFLSALAFLGMVGVLILLRYPVNRILIISIASIGMILSAVLDVIAAFFRAHQRMQLEAVMRISLSVLNMVLGLLVLFAGYGLVGVLTSQSAAFVLILALGLFLMVRYISHPSFSLDLQTYKGWLKKALPFALSSVFIFIYDGTAVIFISLIKGDQATGLFSAAMNFIKVFGLLPVAIVAAVLPVMAQSWLTSTEAWSIICRRSLKYLLIIALPISMGLMILRDRLVLLIFGSAYADAGLILGMAAWVIVLSFLNHGFSTSLISMDREKTLLRIVGIVMFFNVLSNLSLIFFWGAFGAVVAMLLTEGLMLLSQFDVIRRAHLSLRLRSIALTPVLSAVIMGLSVYLVRDLNLIVVILFGAIIYLLALFLLRTFEEDEILLIIDLVKRGLAKFGRGGQKHVTEGGSDI